MSTMAIVVFRSLIRAAGFLRAAMNLIKAKEEHPLPGCQALFVKDLWRALYAERSTRDAGQETWELVGEAYVQGMMLGEAVEGAEVIDITRCR